MLLLLILHIAMALAAPFLVRWWGSRACLVLALAPAAAFGWALHATAAVHSGEPIVETYPWVPVLHLDVALRLTTLSWLMALLVGGIGALVLVYSGYYFARDDPGLGRFAACFVGFAGAMLGLVLADHLLLLYVFWELTSIFSYLLIGHDPERHSGRLAASQALLVTTLGGLAMLVGFVLLGQHTGTYRWSQISSGPAPSGTYVSVSLALILAGAITKSAIFPASFWLSAAMVAPTPVTAYLHAAAMVKAGVYLVALLAPVLAPAAGWLPLVTVAGAVTMLSGAWAALRQTDLKLLLAYGTVSQLGLLFAMLGGGTRQTALAGVGLLFSHALLKAALFCVTGIVDHHAGTRDLSVLSGLWRRMPAVFAVAVVAAASLAGIAPLLGFVAKEAVFDALLTRPAILAVVVVDAVLTTAYSLRFLWGAFADKPGLAPTPVTRVGIGLLVPPALLASATVVLGVLAHGFGTLLSPYPDLFGGPQAHFGLWRGLTYALGLSVLSLVAGVLLFVWRNRMAPVLTLMRMPIGGARVYQWLVGRLDRLAVRVTGVVQRGSLPQYLGTILVALTVAPGAALLVKQPWPRGIEPWASPLQLVIGVVIVVAAVFAARARLRLTATVLVGVTGYGIGLLFILHGAPDLALTQFLVETITVVGFVLVLRRLPLEFSTRPLRTRRTRVRIGIGVGLVMSGLSVAALGGRRAVPISATFPALAGSFGHGRNIVTVTLTDIRAWDTLGEIAVLVVAAAGVISLIYQRARYWSRGQRPNLTSPTRHHVAQGGVTGTERGDSRSTIVLEVAVRLLFHTMVLFSVYLVVSGHNAPGGGFVGGLVAGLALAARYLAGGRDELDRAVGVDQGWVFGGGLFLSAGTALAALIYGGTALKSRAVTVPLPVVGDVHVVTTIFFDFGVYLIVVGLALSILRGLGGEIDRQMLAEHGPGSEWRRAGSESRGPSSESRRAGSESRGPGSESWRAGSESRGLGSESRRGETR